MALFNKKNKEENKEIEAVKEETKTVNFASEDKANVAYKILKELYISEKTSRLTAFDQYVFKVFNNANKSEIAKVVSDLYKVEVKDVKILNMNRKRKDLGKHPGFKSGFKKAIVTLEKGYSIQQTKV